MSLAVPTLKLLTTLLVVCTLTGCHTQIGIVGSSTPTFLIETEPDETGLMAGLTVVEIGPKGLLMGGWPSMYFLDDRAIVASWKEEARKGGAEPFTVYLNVPRELTLDEVATGLARIRLITEKIREAGKPVVVQVWIQDFRRHYVRMKARDELGDRTGERKGQETGGG